MTEEKLQELSVMARGYARKLAYKEGWRYADVLLSEDDIYSAIMLHIAEQIANGQESALVEWGGRGYIQRLLKTRYKKFKGWKHTDIPGLLEYSDSHWATPRTLPESYDPMFYELFDSAVNELTNIQASAFFEWLEGYGNLKALAEETGIHYSKIKRIKKEAVDRLRELLSPHINPQDYYED